MPVVLQPNLKASQINKNTVADISAKLGVVRPLAEVLYTRGFDTVEKAAAYLSADSAELFDPLLLSGMGEAAEIIEAAIKSGEHITVYGDYDVDGVCAVTIMLLTLRALKADVDYYIPDRHDEGYGLNGGAVDKIARRGGVLLTVDCGISSYTEAAEAEKLGLKVVVTDHHSLPEILPECTVINPKMNGDYPFSELCGAGVALKLAQVLLKEEELYSELLDLACIATIADIVPLTSENRLIVKRGLERINTKTRPSLLALIKECGKEPGKISAGDIAFGIAPRLNAAGRLESAAIGVELLLGTGDCVMLAAQMNILNAKRQELEAKVIDEASEMAIKSGQIRSRKIIVVASDEWDKGVVGIAASKLVEKFHRPCILFAVKDGIATGSGRSVEGVNMFEMLSGIKDLLIKYGGHTMAAGLSIEVDKLDDAAERLDEYVRGNIDEKALFPTARYDARVCLAEMNSKLISQLEALAPFGMGNPSPRFRIDHLQSSVCRLVGKNKNHLKIGVRDDATSMEAMLFSYDGSGIHIDNDFYYTLVGSPSVSVWNNIERISFIIDGARRDRDYEIIKDTIFHKDEKLFRAFFEQIMYNIEKDADGSAEECERVESFEELCVLINGLLSEDVTGTLIVCNHPAVALKVSELVFTGHPRCDIDFFNTANDLNGYNTLLIGGSLSEIRLETYRTVVLCDCCCEQMPEYISANAPHIELYSMWGETRDYLKSCPKKYMDFSRENMGKAYKAIKNACTRTAVFESKDTFLRIAASEFMLSEMLISIAAEVFAELGFFSIQEAAGEYKITFRPDAKQNPLTNSKIYNNIYKYQ